MATTSPGWTLWTGVGLILLGLTLVTASGFYLLAIALANVCPMSSDCRVEWFGLTAGLLVGVTSFVIGLVLTQRRP